VLEPWSTKLSKVYITDYIQNPDIEKNILNSELGDNPLEAEIMLVWHQTIDKEFIEQHPKLKFIIRYGVGFDNIDLDYASKKRIIVCNTPDYGTDEVSDTAICFLMNIARGVTRYDHNCRLYLDSWQENTIQKLRRTSEYKVGIIGAGRIGGSVVLKANALGFKTSIFDPFKPSGYEKMLNTERHFDILDLLADSDIISIHCPLNSDTHELVNNDFIHNMKHGSSIINTARGPIISDLDLLYEALKSGKISNIALDVLPIEPPTDSKLFNAWRSRESWLDGRLLINPHSAYYSIDSYNEMRTKAANNALNIINGKSPLNILNQI
jgi:C-terminal binding protein